VLEIDADIDLRDVEPEWTRTDDDFQLATVVVVFAEILRESPFADQIDLKDLEDEVDRLADEMDDPAVEELADMVSEAERLS